MAFKMKGWSGSQKTSPIRQPKNLQQGLENIQKFISNTVEGIKPQSKSSGFGLTDLEKAQAKKLGISEYQYKTGTGISSSTRHKKRMLEKKHKLGKYALPDDPLTKEILDPSDNQALTKYGPTQQQEVSDDATTPTEEDWITREGDPWSYRKTDKGYQTRKGDGTVIDVFNKNSKLYRDIAEKVFDIENTAYESETSDVQGTGKYKNNLYYKDEKGNTYVKLPSGKTMKTSQDISVYTGGNK